MLRNKRITKGLSLLITMVMILGYFTSFVYAEKDQLNSAKVDLLKEASEKIEIGVMKDLKDDDFVEILVYMKDQVDTEMVAKATKSAISSAMTPYNTKLEVRRGVVEALRDKSEMTQMNILNYLEQEMEKGNVVEFTPYHIVNMVYVKATKEVVEDISFMTEVEKIYKNKVHTLDIPEMNGDIQPSATGVEWNITRVKADQVWDLGYDGTGIVVGSLDSGMDWTHPALKNKWRGYDSATGTTTAAGNWFDPVYNAALPADSDSHGTHVMGTIVGQEPDGSNPVGVAPGAKWIGARVFNTAGSTTDAILLSAAEWMLHPGGDPDAAPDVVNNSWGGGAGIDDWYRNAVRSWRAAGIFPVFSAGNQRTGEPLPTPGTITVPSNYPESFAVAAVDKYDIRASFSKLGPSPYDPSLIKPNISAPGVSIKSSIPGGVYTSGYSGTSMAAPHIAGTVALLLSANSSLTIEDVEEIIATTANPLVDATYPTAPNFGYGYGMVDAFEAVSSVASGTGYIAGKVLKDGEDMEDAVIIHEQEVTEVYAGSDIDIIAQIKDDVAVTEVELLIKQQGKTYWLLAPMNRVSGDHKDGMYKGTITYDMLVGDSLVYKIRARDYAGEGVVSQDYKVDISFGIVPGEYNQGFEENALGWIFDGAWEWGKPSGTSPQPFEGENVAGTVLAGNYPNGANSWMITPPIDLRDDTLGSATLRFQQWYATQAIYDYGTILVTNDYGENWTQVGPQYNGDAKSWKEIVVNLGGYIGSQEPVFVAFRFVSNASTQNLGWYVDNVRLIGVDAEAPATPMDLTAVPNIRGIKLNWVAVADGDLSHYNIYRSEVAEGEYIKIAEAINNNFVDDTVEQNSTYYYKVAAVDLSANIGEYSNEANATALDYIALFSTDFETDNGGFTTGVTVGTNNSWAWGIPTSGPNRANSGEKLWATNLAGNYTASNDAYIQSPDIVIPEDSGAVLTFTHWYDFEGTTTKYDYGQVQVSKDNGVTWINITPEADGKYGRRVQLWETVELPLDAFDGETIKIRFFFHCDSSVHYTGWYVDDVYVMGANGSPTPEEPTPTAELGDSIDEEKFIEPEADFSLKRTETNNYETVEDIEVANMPMARGSGIPVTGAVVTVLENGRSVKTDPVTGKFNMRHPIGELFTLRAEAYGYYSKDMTIAVNEDQTTNTRFILDPKPQGTITGRVFDRYYNTPASYAVIRVVEDGKVAPVTADAEGNFTIPNVYEGRYTLKVIANDFEPGETTVVVAGNEIANIEIPLKRFVGYEDQIIYDDGTGENALVLNGAGYGLAVRFTPAQYGKVKGTNVYFWDNSWPSPGGNRIGFTIYSTDENGTPIKVGEPIFTNVVRGQFNYIDLSSFGFSTDRDFYISTIQDAAGTSCPGTGIDEASPHGDRSYLNIDGTFETFAENDTEGGLMMRAVMEYSVSVPTITNLEGTSYTNQDAITVEGTVAAEGKVNVYVNNVKINSVNSLNKKFTAEVDLPEDINTIKVTAEMDGIETEPSTPVTVIKDKSVPVLVVNEPLDNAKVNVEVVHVRGNVTDDIRLEKLTINEKEVAVDNEGNFQERLMLDSGQNIITVKARDGAGNITTVVRTVIVELESPAITNILPNQDVSLREGEVLTVSFNAPTGGSGYFKLVMPFGLDSNEIGIPMTEVDGRYTGTWTVPARLVATGLRVQVVYVSEYGFKITETAAGRVTVIGNMANLAFNSVIIGDEAFDMDYLNTDADAQAKLIKAYNSGEEVYIKMNDSTIVSQEGRPITMAELPDAITHFDTRGNITYYEKY